MGDYMIGDLTQFRTGDRIRVLASALGFPNAGIGYGDTGVIESVEHGGALLEVTPDNPGPQHDGGTWPFWPREIEKIEEVN